MKISLIGHGLIEIPPTGWGAVESIIADYASCLTALGHEVQIVNEKSPSDCVAKANAFNADVLWLHDDRKTSLLPQFTAASKIVTTHDPMFRHLLPDVDCDIYCLSQKQMDVLAKAGHKKLYLTPNGASDLFRFLPTAEINRLICPAKQSLRKRQHLLERFPVNCIGPGTLLGEWTRDEMYQMLTAYHGMILLSQHEAAPLVVPEALMAGLPIIISEAASANLPPLPFVRVLHEDEILVESLRRRAIETFMATEFDRVAIRAWALANLDWKVLTPRLPFLN